MRIHGGEEQAAKLLKELVLADVEVIGLTRIRSDLEDVYQQPRPRQGQLSRLPLTAALSPPGVDILTRPPLTAALSPPVSTS